MTTLTRRQEKILAAVERTGYCRLASANDRRSADALERKGLGRREGPIFYPPTKDRYDV